MDKEEIKNEFKDKENFISSFSELVEKVAKVAVKQFLTPQDAQMVFGISRQYLSFLSKLGCFPRYCPSKSVTLYRYDEIEAWLLTTKQEGNTKWSDFKEEQTSNKQSYGE